MNQSLDAGTQTVNFASRVNQDLTAAPVIEGKTWTVPAAPGSLSVLLAGQTDATQNGVYDVSKVAGVITWTRRLLTAPDCQIQVAVGAGQGFWAIPGTPSYGTDPVVVRRLV